MPKKPGRFSIPDADIAEGHLGKFLFGELVEVDSNDFTAACLVASGRSPKSTRFARRT